MGPTALIVAEPAALVLAGHVADRLEAHGVRVDTGHLELAGVPDSVDLVVLGASVASFRSARGEALRSWLVNSRATRHGQIAAAFDLRHGRLQHPVEATAPRALRALSAHGFRLAAKPISLAVHGDDGTPAWGEAARAEEWATRLALSVHLARRTQRRTQRWAVAG